MTRGQQSGRVNELRGHVQAAGLDMREGFSAFYMREFVDLKRFAQSLDRSGAVAEDVASTAMLVVFDKWSELCRGQAGDVDYERCRRYAYGTVKRLILDCRRRAFRQQTSVEEDIERVADRPGGLEENPVLWDVDLHVMAESLALLSEDQRAAILLQASGMTVKDIAARLRVTEKRTYHLLSRGRDRLRELVAARSGESEYGRASEQRVDPSVVRKIKRYLAAVIVLIGFLTVSPVAGVKPLAVVEAVIEAFFEILFPPHASHPQHDGPGVLIPQILRVDDRKVRDKGDSPVVAMQAFFVVAKREEVGRNVLAQRPDAPGHVTPVVVKKKRPVLVLDVGDATKKVVKVPTVAIGKIGDLASTVKADVTVKPTGTTVFELCVRPEGGKLVALGVVVDTGGVDGC